MPRRRNDQWIYVGRLSDEKGVPELLADFPESKRLTIVGDGPLRDYVAYEAARSRGRITYLGMLDRSTVLEHVANAVGLVFPSKMPEGIPTVVIEALAVGTPVAVSTACTSAPDLTKNSAGVTFSVRGDGLPLSSAVGAIEKDWATFSRQASVLHSAEYSPDNWVRNVARLYESLL
jgi:glycosyltransferase involved in cell wall biosynthesis